MFAALFCGTPKNKKQIWIRERMSGGLHKIRYD